MPTYKRRKRIFMNNFYEYNFNIPEYVRTVLDRLHQNGEDAYIVGGSLRDMLLGVAPHDFDLACSAEPLRTCEIFSDMRVIETGLSHGTVTVISQGQPIEITTFRVDGEYLDMRRPESVSFTRNIEDDLSRRDFTVNAMAFDGKDKLIDLFCGQDDLNNKIIRTVGNPYERFSEDALRIMRAFRFSAQLGFEIEEKTLAAAGDLACKLSLIAKERILSEFTRLLCSPYPEKPLKQMRSLGVLAYVLPNYSPSDEAISLLQTIANLKITDETTRLAAFFSDTDGDNARKELVSLKASRAQRSVCYVVDALKLDLSLREDYVRLRSKLGLDAKIALRLSVLLNNSPESSLAFIDDATPCSISELALSGNDLIALGYSGREIGKTLARLLDEVIKNPSLNSKEALLELLNS